MEVGKAIVAVLEQTGSRSILPRQNCCGLPMQSNGDFDGSATLRAGELASCALRGPGLPIVVGGTSCGLELK